MGRRRIGWTWLGLVLAASGCHEPDKSYVLLSFKGTVDQPIRSIAVNLTLGSRTDSTSFESPAGGDIKLPVKAALEVGSGEGDLAVSARALDHRQIVVAEGSGSGHVTAGETSTVEIKLSASIRDAGVDPLTAPDAAGFPTPDGPGVATDLFAPDPDTGAGDAAIAGSDSADASPTGGQGGATGGAGGATTPETSGGAGGATGPETTVGAGGATTPPTTPDTGGAGGTSITATGGTTMPVTSVGTGGAGGTLTTATPPGCKLSVSPPTLDFGTVAVGGVSQPQPVIATNVGSGVCSNLVVFVNDGRHFPVFETPCSGQVLGPNFSCKALFTFNPDAVGPFQTDASITPAEGPPVRFLLAGKGQDSLPQIMMNPTKVDFTLRDVGSVASMEFTVTSTDGPDPGTIDVLLNGSPAFSVVNNQCASAILPAGGRCTFTLLFIPPGIGRGDVQIDAKSKNGARATSSATGTGRDYAQLKVLFAGTGKGTVSGANLNCRSGSPCGLAIERTDPMALPKIELVAEPDSLSQFMGWSGPCGGAGTCGFVMDGPKSVTATFDVR
jgi:hypothetical protein